MKYLDYFLERMLYSHLESEVQPIIDEINDILLDLTDKNEWSIRGAELTKTTNSSFKVDVKPIGPLKNSGDKLGILVTINKPEGFIRGDSEEVISRVDDYLKPMGWIRRSTNFDGYTLSVIWRWNGRWINESNSVGDNICLDLEDMLLEIGDIHPWKARVYNSKMKKTITVNIRINEDFELEDCISIPYDVIETSWRIVEYMKSLGFTYNVKLTDVNSYDYKTIDVDDLEGMSLCLDELIQLEFFKIVGKKLSNI